MTTKRERRTGGFPPTRSIRAFWTLRELDVEFEFVNIDLTKAARSLAGAQEGKKMRGKQRSRSPGTPRQNEVLVASMAWPTVGVFAASSSGISTPNPFLKTSESALRSMREASNVRRSSATSIHF
jgi:hypothetical protein